MLMDLQERNEYRVGFLLGATFKGNLLFDECIKGMVPYQHM